MFAVYKRAKLACLILLVSFAANLSADANPLGKTEKSSPKLLLTSSSPQQISFKDALSRALLHHSKIRLAKNHSEQRFVGTFKSIARILPKLHFFGSFTRNIPEIERTFLNNYEAQSEMGNHVAGLLRKSGDNAAADALERQSNLLLRRNNDNKFILHPKHVTEGKIVLEVPLLDLNDLAGIFTSKAEKSLADVRVREEEANALYQTAKLYIEASLQKDIVDIYDDAAKLADERNRQRRGSEADNLLKTADLLKKQADYQKSLFEYRSTLAHLGILLDMSEEFSLGALEIPALSIEDSDEELIENARRERLDVLALKQSMKVTDNERFGNVMKFVPRIWLQADANFTTNNRDFIGEHATYAISINAHLNLFDGGITFASLRENSLKKQEYEIKSRQLLSEIDASIRGRREKLKTAELYERALAMKAQAAQALENSSRALYRNGRLTLEELINVSDKKIEAVIAYKNAQYAVHQEKIALLHEASLLTRELSL